MDVWKFQRSLQRVGGLEKYRLIYRLMGLQGDFIKSMGLHIGFREFLVVLWVFKNASEGVSDGFQGISRRSRAFHGFQGILEGLSR